MLLRKANTRRLSRLVAGLFAVQIVVTGFCLLTTQAHAMPMAQMDATHMSDTQMGSTSGHCSESMLSKAQHAGTSHGDGCFHCDEPAQFVKAGNADTAPVSLVLTCLTMLPEPVGEGATDIKLIAFSPTGPPRSDSLLLSTTQRLRI